MPVSTDEQARVLSKLDALRDQLLFEPGTEALRSELDGLRVRVRQRVLQPQDVAGTQCGTHVMAPYWAPFPALNAMRCSQAIDD